MEPDQTKLKPMEIDSKPKTRARKLSISITTTQPSKAPPVARIAQLLQVTLLKTDSCFVEGT
jgi:hypothetical protein